MPPSSSTTNSKNKLASKISSSSTAATSSSSSSGVDEELTAAPREGCIEVRKLRLRIRLFEQHLPWDADRQHQSSPAPPAGRSNNGCDERTNNYNNSSNNDDRQITTTQLQLQQYRGNNDTPGLDGWNDNALVVRRRNTLLITTRRGRGAIMFRFLSTRDCVDFCDQLVYLNRHLLFRNDDDEVVRGADEDVMTVKDIAAVSGGGRKTKSVIEPNELRIDEVNSAKRRRLTVLGDHNRREDVGCGAEMQTPRQEAIVNYLVQLAHSQDFCGFVDEIERGLEYGDDTAAIHAALGV
jgi:hypothetical protein